MSVHLPFRYLEPAFYAGLLDDPVLYLKVRPLGEGLLIDCGQIHHLAKRVLKSLSALFITHAHMDHFMGIDTFIRNVHVSPRTFDLYGPPGLAEKLAHKLAGYDWNLTEDSWCAFRVQEIHPDRLVRYFLPGAAGFPKRFEEEAPRGREKTVYRNRYLSLEAELCDHKIPTLVFRINERPGFKIDNGKLDRQNLVRGPWLREMNRRFFRGGLEGRPLRVLRRRGKEVVEETVSDAGALFRAIRRETAGPAIGYLTDLGFTEENRAKIRELLQGVTLLICECTFLSEDRDKARASYHLCTDDLNCLLRELRPAYVLPVHLSKAYLGRTDRLYRQLEPPPGTTLLCLPEHRAPRPLLPREMPWIAGTRNSD